MINKFTARKRGISLLVPTQNSEKTVELCIRSFVNFADEIIVVDNGSTDRTKEIVTGLVKEYEHMTFFDAPDLKDLYENRQYALERSKFDWIVRIDSDYVAYTDGLRDIRKLRKIILAEPRTLRPKAFTITQVNLTYDVFHTGEENTNGRETWVQAPINTLKARIIQHYPGMKFQRIGRWEGVRWQRYLKHKKLSEPYWFHCNFKSNRDLLFRSERTNWRELGNFIKYPTLASYVESVILSKYNTSDLDQASEILFKDQVEPLLKKYNPEVYYQYPSSLGEIIRQGFNERPLP